MTTIRVLLADYHEIVRQGLRALLGTIPDVEVVGDVGDVAGAVEGVRISAPDLVVLDRSMPKSAIGEITAVRPETQIIVLARHRDPTFARDAFSAGASGYVLQQSPFSELVRAIDTVARGENYVDKHVAPSDTTAPPTRSFRAVRVTDRESDVLKRTALGHSHKDVASALGVAARTIEAHKTNAMRKLGLRGRKDLVRYAVDQGWLNEA